MSDSENLFGNVPAPGEPLEYREAEHNRAVVEADLQARLARLQAKIPKKELEQLHKRYEQLRKELNKARWNDLINLRDQLYVKYKELGEKYQKALSSKKKAVIDALKSEGLSVASEGRRIVNQIKILRPLADEIKQIAARIQAHDDVVAWEIQEDENKKAFKREVNVWLESIRAICYNSPRLHHSWTDEKGKNHTDIPVIEAVDHKPDKVYFKIEITEQVGLFRWKTFYRSLLPKGVDIHNLTCDETLENLSAACKRRVTIERSADGSAVFWVVSRLDSTDGTPNLVPYSQIVPYYPREKHALAPYIAGISSDKKVETFNFYDAPHMLIAGSTSSGKSTFVNSLISTIITMNSPDEARLILIDNKGGLELSQFETAKHNLIPMISRREDVLDALTYLEEIMVRRFATMGLIKQRSIIAYNALVKPESRMARVFGVVDEMATLTNMPESPLIQQKLRVLSGQGRAVGVHLILCTQNTQVKIIEGDIKTNFRMRISGLMPDLASSMTILGSPAATRIPEGVPGRFVFRWGIKEYFIQTPLISDIEIERAVQIANEFPDPVNASEFNFRDDDLSEDEPSIIPKPVEKFGRNDLLKVVLDNLGGHLSSKAVHEIIGGAQTMPRRVLDAMCKEIGDAGTVTYQGVTYIVQPKRKAKYLIPQETPRENNPVTDSMPDGIEANEVLE